MIRNRLEIHTQDFIQKITASHQQTNEKSKRQETRDKRQETSDKRQETRDKRRETRDERRDFERLEGEKLR